ncbi:MAG: hypothetical protein LCH85_02695 [Chloroflexi bacterium]|nr:hypothetical protein [Chloroflexota bacterium]
MLKRYLRWLGVVVGFCMLMMLMAACEGQKPNYQVEVTDSLTNKPIIQAKVTIILPNHSPLEEYTGNNGFAIITIKDEYINQLGRLSIEKTGYASYANQININVESLPKQIKLEPIQAPQPTPTPENTPIAATPTIDVSTSCNGKAINDDYAGAIQACTEYIKINQAKYEGYYNRGMLYANPKVLKCADSIADFDRAADLKQELADIYYQRGLAYRDCVKDLDAAYADLTKAIELNPPYQPNVYFNRGVVEVSRLQLEAARVDFAACIRHPKVTPEQKQECNNWLMQINLESCTTPSTMTIIGGAQAASANAQTLFNQGVTAMGTKDWEVAINLFTQAIDDTNGFDDAFAMRGRSYLKLYHGTKTEEYLNLSIVDLQHSVALNPNNFAGHYNLSAAYTYLYDLKDQPDHIINCAVEHSIKSNELKPEDASAWKNTGMHLLDQAIDLCSAINALNQSLKVNPKYEANYFYLSRAYAMLNDKPQALKYFELLANSKNSDPEVIELQKKLPDELAIVNAIDPNTVVKICP